jgi:hypothetical protein
MGCWSNGPSEQWAVGIMGCRNNDLTPLQQRNMLKMVKSSIIILKPVVFLLYLTKTDFNLYTYWADCFCIKQKGKYGVKVKCHDGSGGWDFRPDKFFFR